MDTLLFRIRTFFYRTDGVTSIEYALIAALIVLAIVAAVMALGQQVAALFNAVVDAFP